MGLRRMLSRFAEAFLDEGINTGKPKKNVRFVCGFAQIRPLIAHRSIPGLGVGISF
jgi:hypothetical protein